MYSESDVYHQRLPSCIAIIGHACCDQIGHAKSTSIHRDTFIGKEATLKHQTLHNVSLARPIQHGLIRHWDDMTTFWRFLFDKELHCDDDLEYSGLVLSETPLNPRINREKTAQIVFETFQFGSYYTQSSAVFELYSHGQTTGMVVGVGYDSSYTVPVFQGTLCTLPRVLWLRMRSMDSVQKMNDHEIL